MTKFSRRSNSRKANSYSDIQDAIANIQETIRGLESETRGVLTAADDALTLFDDNIDQSIPLTEQTGVSASDFNDAKAALKDFKDIREVWVDITNQLTDISAQFDSAVRAAEYYTAKSSRVNRRTSR